MSQFPLPQPSIWNVLRKKKITISGQRFIRKEYFLWKGNMYVKNESGVWI
jgi:hypothetical protein